MRYENKKIKELTRGKKCYLDVPFVCEKDLPTVVPCHSPDYDRIHGKEGMNVKAHDIFLVPGCQKCHDFLDGRATNTYYKEIFSGLTGREKNTLRQFFFNKAHSAFLVDICRSGEIKDALTGTNEICGTGRNEITGACNCTDLSNSALTAGSVTCCWRSQLYDEQVWDTECGGKWILAEGTPCDNGMNFCFSCGKRIDE